MKTLNSVCQTSIGKRFIILCAVHIHADRNGNNLRQRLQSAEFALTRKQKCDEKQKVVTIGIQRTKATLSSMRYYAEELHGKLNWTRNRKNRSHEYIRKA